MVKRKVSLEGIDIFEIGLDLKRSVYKTVKALPDSYSLLIIVKTKRYEKLLSALLDLYVNDEKRSGLFISTNKPVVKVIGTLDKEKKVGTEKIYFVDCMTELSRLDGKIFYCPPQNLTDLNLAIEKMLKMHEDIGFVLLDSLSTLFIYNEDKPVQKFITTLIRKTADRKMKGIFITTKTANNAAALEDLAIFFDEVLTLNL
tara:strand:- start:194 stop:796 length:603 start_codon:yes stop_codon:yes gene_type:complete